MDNNIEKAVKPEVSKDTLLEVIKELQEIIVGMVSTEEPEDEEMDTETADSDIEITPTNPSPIGDPDKNEVNWPVEKIDGQLIISEEERAILEQEKMNGKQVKKSAWNQMFDPRAFNKRTF